MLLYKLFCLSVVASLSLSCFNMLHVSGAFPVPVLFTWKIAVCGLIDVFRDQGEFSRCSTVQIKLTDVC